MQSRLSILALGALLLVAAATPGYSQDDNDFFKETKAKPSTQKKRSATDDLIQFSVTVEPPEARRGQTVKVIIKGTPKEGYWAYPLTQRAPGQDAAYLLRDLVFAD